MSFSGSFGECKSMGSTSMYSTCCDKLVVELSATSNLALHLSVGCVVTFFVILI